MAKNLYKKVTACGSCKGLVVQLTLRGKITKVAGPVISYKFQANSAAKMGQTLLTETCEDGIDFFGLIFPLSGDATNYDRVRATYEGMTDEHQELIVASIGGVEVLTQILLSYDAGKAWHESGS